MHWLTTQTMQLTMHTMRFITHTVWFIARTMRHTLRIVMSRHETCSWCQGIQTW